MRSTPFSLGVVRALVAAPFVEQLTHLALVATQMKEKVAIALAAAPLGELKTLSLPMNRIGVDGLRALCQSGMPKLTRLDLRSNSMPGVGGCSPRQVSRAASRACTWRPTIWAPPMWSRCLGRCQSFGSWRCT